MPRIHPLTAAEANPESARLLESLAAHRADVHPLLEIMAHSRSCFRPFLRLPDAIIRFSALDPKLREIAVMRLAQRMDSEYEWELHERYAVAAGLDAAELAQLRAGTADATEFTPLELAVVRLADEALAGKVTDATFAEVRAGMDDEQAVELALALAWWAGLVPVLNEVLGIALDGYVARKDEPSHRAGPRAGL
ncbi:MAG: carboxymuconolactone decarboxylase family protein [Dehalococcoidia bacterium]|nr:carboxymuconolactone decarboxylase family protein [Dehalococcoidia bacterium]